MKLVLNEEKYVWIVWVLVIASLTEGFSNYIRTSELCVSILVDFSIARQSNVLSKNPSQTKTTKTQNNPPAFQNNGIAGKVENKTNKNQEGQFCWCVFRHAKQTRRHEPLHCYFENICRKSFWNLQNVYAMLYS